MRKTRTSISKDKDTLLEILTLRRAGWTFVSLSELYNCDRTSLRYQCRKYKIFPTKKIYIKNSNEVFDPKRIAVHVLHQLYPIVLSSWTVVDGEKINTGKTYAEYLLSVSPYKATQG